MNNGRRSSPPILEHDDPDAPSLFTAEAMIALARRRKGLSDGGVPDVCVLDPDGDLAQHLEARGHVRNVPHWACFHTRLAVHDGNDQRFGIIERAVGAPFSVLVAEQLFASGCRFLISLSSAGQIADVGRPPYFVAIESALRDEGTSYHYLPPSRYVRADPGLLAAMLPALRRTHIPLHVGASWTTDAPFRETSAKVRQRHAEGLLTVEMESAGLYAFAEARRQPVLCLAQVTNCLGQRPEDFHKGISEGAEAAFLLVTAAISAWTLSARTWAAFRIAEMDRSVFSEAVA